MHIRFSPMRRDDRLTLSRQGDVLSINGEAFDFSALPEGALLPREAVDCAWLASGVTRQDGVIHLTLILPHGPKASQQSLFPAPADAPEGDIPVPAHSPEEDQA